MVFSLRKGNYYNFFETFEILCESLPGIVETTFSELGENVITILDEIEFSQFSEKASLRFDLKSKVSIPEDLIEKFRLTIEMNFEKNKDILIYEVYYNRGKFYVRFYFPIFMR